VNNTKIEWCDKTWNPVTGCFHDCPYCYARSIVKRFGRPLASPNCYESPDGAYGLYKLDEPDMKILYNKGDKPGINPYPQGFRPTFHRYRLNEPMNNRKGSVVFVCSMADLFGRWVPDKWIFQVLKSAINAPQHKYFFLTKYPARYKNLLTTGYRAWTLPSLFWYGYSATTQSQLRAGIRDTLGIKNLFVSIEPMHEEIILDGIGKKFGWIIVGAESGNRKTKIVPKWEWLEGIVCYCREHNIPLFMKNSLEPIWEGPLIQQFPQGITVSK